MSQVNTVLGPIDSSELGFTLSHEHITLGAAGTAAAYPGFQDLNAIADAATAALQEAYDGGVRTIIDVTTLDLGRDIPLMQDVSRRSGVHAIPCTGNHLSIPRIFWGAPVDKVAALFIKEIEEGIEDTGVKAGIIKVASDRGGVTENEETVLRAAARACNATGTRISTHTWSPDRVGEEQIRILKDEGVDLNRVYVGHSNDDTDVEYLVGLLEEGVWLGLDRYPGGRTPETPRWEVRTEIVKQLIDAGWAHRLMLSHDHSTPVVQPSDELRREREAFNPDGYLFISRNVLPRLVELGATDADVNTIMVDTPRRFFED
ncbi:MAG: phosphotriesterase-related protein [Chloroflexi bacterium]|nr:phosphotriesterase-related protein [Chloroflexota bacterium]